MNNKLGIKKSILEVVLKERDRVLNKKLQKEVQGEVLGKIGQIMCLVKVGKETWRWRTYLLRKDKSQQLKILTPNLSFGEISEISDAEVATTPTNHPSSVTR